MPHTHRTRLSVNVNKVALLRNSRAGHRPDPLAAAQWGVNAGADGVTVHPRPDERHIRATDVEAITAWLAAWPANSDNAGPRPEYNIEGNPFQGRYMELVEAARPTQATLVPDTPGQSTSDHGWPLHDASAQGFDMGKLRSTVERLQGWGCRVSLFMDADVRAIRAAPATGADRIELYTEPYAAAFERGEAGAVQEQLRRFAEAAMVARDLGLGLNAGHDLNLNNLGPFLEAVPGVLEVSIGHALVADALAMGMPEAVRRYAAIARGEAASGF